MNLFWSKACSVAWQSLNLKALILKQKYQSRIVEHINNSLRSVWVIRAANIINITFLLSSCIQTIHLISTLPEAKRVKNLGFILLRLKYGKYYLLLHLSNVSILKVHCHILGIGTVNTAYTQLLNVENIHFFDIAIVWTLSVCQ